MTEQEPTNRSLLLDSLLELAPIERESTVRVLEIGTGRDGGHRRPNWLTGWTPRWSR